MVKFTKAQLEQTIAEQENELIALRAELETAIGARDAFFALIARMTVWHFMVARCAKQL